MSLTKTEIPRKAAADLIKYCKKKGHDTGESADEMLKNYYEKMGWDPETGVPTKETLERLGIGPVWDNL